LLSADIKSTWGKGEYYALIAVTTLGMSLMASSADLIMLYLAIETTSIPMYILAGFMKTDEKSTESGMKYFLFGAFTSAIMLYGFTLLFGFAGVTNIYQIAEALQVGELSTWALGGSAILVLVGFGFKVSAVPFHFWSPDVYEGAPTPITAYISTASKAAGFAVLVRVMLAAFPAIAEYWSSILAAMAIASMTIGNLIALAQKNIKRLLAYSSIAHAGYALIGLVALSSFGAASVIFYLVAYVVTNLAAFAVVILFARAAGSEEIADYVFAAAVESDLVWLAFIGVLNAIIGLYYYLTVLKVVYLYRSEDEDVPIPVSRPSALALIVCVAAIVLIGSFSGPYLNWALDAAQSLF
jgi:NADH-quinone oxidoreductase subunit N